MNFTLIDLTHPLSSNIPTWDEGCGFYLESIQGDDSLFRLQNISMPGGVGTHLDAPSHLFSHASPISEIPLEQLLAPACVINVSKKATTDYRISVDDIKQYEETYGLVEGLVIGYTGWDRLWANPKAYRNQDSKGERHFPAFSKEAAELLLTRNIVGLAIDTLSPDCGDPSYPVHTLLLGKGKYILENIANASLLPPKGAYVLSLPIPIQGGTEAPARVIGMIPKT